MTRTETIARALRLAFRGTVAQIDSFEDVHGMSLSDIIDEAWAEADDNGDKVLARQCERAFNHLTGR